MAKNKVLIIISFLILSQFAIGQKLKEQKLLLEKSLSIFCDSIIHNENLLNGYKYIFEQLSSGEPSNIAHVAYCKNDITLFDWNKISDIVKLHGVKKEKTYTKIKLINNNLPFANWFEKRITKRFYNISINHPIIYDNFYYVEIYLLSKAPAEIIIVLQFNKHLKYVQYYLKYIDL